MSKKKLLRTLVMGIALVTLASLASPASGSQPQALTVAPPSGPQGAQNYTIHVAGAQFAGGAQVSFNDPNITVIRTLKVPGGQDEVLEAQVNIASGTDTAKKYNVIVTNPDGGTATCADCFSVSAGPSITSVCTLESMAPGSECRKDVATDTPSQMMVVQGTNLNGLATIQLGGKGLKVNSVVIDGFGNVTTRQTPAANGTLAFDMQVSSTAGPGLHSITLIMQDGGRATCATCINVIGGTPVASSVSPRARGAGALNQTVSIFGKNLFSGATVAFSNPGIHINGAPSVPRAGKVVVNVNIDPSAAPGPGDVTVTNTDGNASTCRACFEVTPGPTIALGVTPQGPQGIQGLNVSIPGGGFQRGVKAYFPRANCIGVGGGTLQSCSDDVFIERTVFTDPNQPLTANIDIAPYNKGARGSHLTPADAGLRLIAVVNPDGGTAICTADSAACFNVALGPKVGAIDPAAVPRGTSQQQITVSVQDVSGPVSLAFTGGGITVEQVGPAVAGTVNAVITISPNAVISDRNVIVGTQEGGRGVCIKCFKVDWPLPIPRSALPSQAVIGATNYRVRISGSNFPPGSVVTIADPQNAIHTTANNWFNVGTINAVITVDDNATPGPHDILVTNPSGKTGRCANCFTINAAPVVEAVTPPRAAAGGSHINILIHGGPFVNGARVDIVCNPETVANCINGVKVHRTTWQSPTTLLAEISISPTASTDDKGYREVHVYQPDGSHAVWFRSFEVVSTPV